METEENRRALLRGAGLEGSGGGARGPGGGVLGKCEPFTGPEETPPQVGVFQVASRSLRVPSPFHSFRWVAGHLPYANLGIRWRRSGGDRTGDPVPGTWQRLSPFICSPHSPHTWRDGRVYGVARPFAEHCTLKAPWLSPLLPDARGGHPGVSVWQRRPPLPQMSTSAPTRLTAPNGSPRGHRYEPRSKPRHLGASCPPSCGCLGRISRQQPACRMEGAA